LTDAAPPELTETQRRRLEVRLGRLALEAQRLLERIEREVEPGVEGQGRRLVEIGAEFRKLLTELEDAGRRLGLSLRRPGPDLLRDVGAWAALSWARVLDCRPSRLTGGGPLDPRARGPLDHAVDRVSERLEVIRSLASDEREGG
jgi:hypothetical protein